MIELVYETVGFGLVWVLLSGWRALPLLVIVLVLDLVLRRRIAARFHCMLWALVMIRLLCGVSVPSSLSVQSHLDRMGTSVLEYESEAPPPPPSVLKFDTYTFEEDGKTITLPVIPEDATAEFRAEAEAYVASLQTPGPYAEQYNAVTDSQSESEWGWETILSLGILGTWFSVASFLLIRSGASHLSFARRLRDYPLVNDQAMVDQVATACRRLHVRRAPVVKEVDELSVPAVFGIWRHTICLPVGTSAQLTSDELDWVLMHEIAHIKRCDALLLSMSMFVRALQWFNPFAHVAVSRLRHHMEQAADDLATRRMPQRSIVGYGRLLLRYASEQHTPRYGATIGLLFVSSSKSLRRRIEMLDQNRRRNHWLAKVVAIAAIPASSVGRGSWL